MSVNGEHHLLHGGLKLHSGHGFGDQLRGLRSNDVHTQDFAVLLFRYDFDETVMVADDAGLRVCGERKLADLDFVALLSRLGFGQSHAADLWLAVSCSWDQVALHGTCVFTRDFGHGNHALHRRYVG